MDASELVRLQLFAHVLRKLGLLQVQPGPSMSRLQTLKTHYRRWGFMRTACFVAMWVASRVLRLHLFVVRTRFAEDELNDPPHPDGVEIRVLEHHELEKWARDPLLDLPPVFVREAIERGDTAFGAFDGSNLVAYTWRSATTVPHTRSLWVRVDKPYCYSYKSFARPAYRGKHIVVALILYSDEVMLERGFTHRAGFISVTNFSSLAMRARLGSESLGYAGYVAWFGKYLTFRTGSLKDIGFEFFEPAAPGP